MKIRSPLLMLFVSMIACGGAPGGAGTTTPASDATKTYPIRLHRHAHVGDRTHVVCDAVEDNSSIMHLASSGRESRTILSKIVPIDENRGVLEAHMQFEMTARIHAPTPTGDDVIGDIIATSREDDRSTPL